MRIQGGHRLGSYCYAGHGLTEGCPERTLRQSGSTSESLYGFRFRTRARYSQMKRHEANHSASEHRGGEVICALPGPLKGMPSQRRLTAA